MTELSLCWRRMMLLYEKILKNPDKLCQIPSFPFPDSKSRDEIPADGFISSRQTFGAIDE